MMPALRMAGPIKPAPEAEDESEDLTSRSDVRRANKSREEALSRLARQLAELAPKQLARLELPESVLEALDVATVIDSPRARERQLRVVRNTLRDAPWPTIRAQLDELLERGTVSAHHKSAGREREWVVRLLGEGKPGLDALLAEHPTADRKHLRQLVRNVERSAPERRGRAEAKLAATLKLMLERG